MVGCWCGRPWKRTSYIKRHEKEYNEGIKVTDKEHMTDEDLFLNASVSTIDQDVPWATESDGLEREKDRIVQVAAARHELASASTDDEAPHETLEATYDSNFKDSPTEHNVKSSHLQRKSPSPVVVDSPSKMSNGLMSNATPADTEYMTTAGTAYNTPVDSEMNGRVTRVEHEEYNRM